MSAEEIKKVSLRIRLPFQTETEFVERYGANIATNGIFIATRQPKPTGTQVSFELVLNDGGRLMRGDGVVLESFAEGQGPRTGMWVKFLKIDPKTKVLIEQALTFHGLPLSPPVAAPRTSVPAPRPSAPGPAAESVLGIAWGTHKARASLMVAGGHVRITGADTETADWAVPPREEHARWLEVLTSIHIAAEQQLEQTLKRAVLSVPSTFTLRERRWLIEAAEAAGLTLLQVVNDASSLALAFAHGRGLARKRVLVLEVDGGQCGLAVVQITDDDLSVVASGALTFPHPDNVEIQQVLSVVQSTLDAARVTMVSVDEVVCVGEQASQADVQARLSTFFAGRPVHTELSSGHSLGVALLAQAWSARERGKTGAFLAEVVMAPLSISVQGKPATRVLDRGTRLPAEKTINVTVEPSETLEIGLFEGDTRKHCVGVWRASADRRVDWALTVRIASEKALALYATAPGGKKVELTFDKDASLPTPPPPVSMTPVPTEQSGHFLSGLKKWLRG